ncbi:MAG: hypothetical protein HOP19_03890 [Acidobacteria bacterium]|nr:hypothetical protein [Acidobacteriota bacterium]
MSITLTLPLELEQRIFHRAAETKKPVEEVTVGLIAQGLKYEQPHEQPMMTFDEILAPFRQEVAACGISDDELDALFLRARRDYARENQDEE